MNDVKNIQYILYCHYRAWLRYTRRPHFSELSNFGKLIVVENPFIIFSKSNILNLKNEIKNYIKYVNKVYYDERSKAKVLRPTLLFADKIKNKFGFLAKVDRAILTWQLKKILDKEAKNVMILTNRMQEWLVYKKTDEKFLLDINDDWSMIGYNEYLRLPIEQQVKKLIKKVDIVTTVTEKLKEKYDSNYTFSLGNGVDVKHYVPSFSDDSPKVKMENVNEVYDKDYLMKEKNDPRMYRTNIDFMKNINGPIVGSYSGLSGNWSDFNFVNKVEKLLPSEINMICSGNVHRPTHNDFQEEYGRYMENPRMKYLKYVDYSLLPDFLEYLDVGIVMHRMDEFNIHSAPNKIWAYLAMGKPVVSTNFLTDVDKEIYEGLVSFCDTPEEYVECIKKWLVDDNEEFKLKRRDLAVRNSTFERARKLHTKIIENIIY